MARIEPVDPREAFGQTRQLLDDVQAEWGMIPNFPKTLANAPAVLEGYMALGGALREGVLSAELREQIAVAVAEANRCDYCLAAHYAIGRTVGLSEEALTDARRGVSPDRKVEAVLQFALEMVEKRGWVGDQSLSRLRDVGFADQELVEIAANVALNVFTNYLNHVIGTEIDLPRIPQLSGT